MKKAKRVNNTQAQVEEGEQLEEAPKAEFVTGYIFYSQ